VCKKGLNNDYQLRLAKNKTIDNIRKTEAKNGWENNNAKRPGRNKKRNFFILAKKILFLLW
jgi:hypothetical protein